MVVSSSCGMEDSSLPKNMETWSSSPISMFFGHFFDEFFIFSQMCSADLGPKTASNLLAGFSHASSILETLECGGQPKAFGLVGPTWAQFAIEHG